VSLTTLRGDTGSDPSARGATVSGDPLVYRPSPYWLVLVAGCGVVLLTGGLFGIWFFLTGRQGAGIGAALTGVALCSFFVGLAAYVLGGLKMRFSIAADAVEYDSFWQHRRLRRADIEGYRLLRSAWYAYPGALFAPATLVLVPKGDAEKPLRVAKIFAADAPFEAWLARLGNLDAADFRRSEAEILRDPALGDDVSARADALAKARWVGGVLSAIAVALGAWGYLAPNPSGLVTLLLIVMPWVALGMDAAAPGLFAVNNWRNDARSNLAAALILPGLVLTVRALTEYDLLEWQLALGASLIIGGTFALLLALADRSVLNSVSRFILVLPFALFYAFGAVAQANVWLDVSPPTIEQVAVVGKHGSSGTRRASWYLSLAPWGPRTTPEDVLIARPLYDSVRPGDKVCVTVHPGALSISWFSVAPCR
jgi:hypothetical protein